MQTGPFQNVMRMPTVPAIGAAGLYLCVLVAPGAWTIGTDEVGEKLPDV